MLKSMKKIRKVKSDKVRKLELQKSKSSTLFFDEAPPVGLRIKEFRNL